MKKEKFLCFRGGLAIRGHVWGDTESKKAVILSHGFLANERMCFGYAKLLAEMGCLAVTYDFCGGGIISASDGKLINMTPLTEKEDLKAVIAAVKEKFAPESIVLLGLSQGGFVSGLTAAETDSVDKLIMFYPAVSIPDDARNGKMMFYKFDTQNIPPTLGRFPMQLSGDFPKAVINMNQYEEMSGFKKPVLLVHGTADSIVNISYSRRLKEIYPDCTYYEIEGAGHVFKGKYDKTAREYLKEFMKV